MSYNEIFQSLKKDAKNYVKYEKKVYGTSKAKAEAMYVQGKKEGIDNDTIRKNINEALEPIIKERQRRNIMPLELKHTEFANKPKLEGGKLPPTTEQVETPKSAAPQNIETPQLKPVIETPQPEQVSESELEELPDFTKLDTYPRNKLIDIIDSLLIINQEWAEAKSNKELLDELENKKSQIRELIDYDKCCPDCNTQMDIYITCEKKGCDNQNSIHVEGNHIVRDDLTLRRLSRKK